MEAVGNNHLAHVLQEVAGEDEISEAGVVGSHNLTALALPFFMAFVDEDDVLADAHDGVHVVGVDDGGHVELAGDALQQFVDDEGGLGIETRVGLVAEQVFGVEGDGTGNGDALLHTAGNLAGEFLVGSLQIDTVEALLGAVYALAEVHRGEHVEGEHDVLEDGHRVEEGSALEDHAHFAAHEHFFAFRHADEVAAVVEHLSAGGFEQPYEVLHEHGLARAALADDEIGLAVEEGGVDVLQHILAVETFIEVLDFNHDRSWVRNTSLKRIRALEETTASVLALPTLTLPPSTV